MLENTMFDFHYNDRLFIFHDDDMDDKKSRNSTWQSLTLGLSSFFLDF